MPRQARHDNDAFFLKHKKFLDIHHFSLYSVDKYTYKKGEFMHKNLLKVLLLGTVLVSGAGYGATPIPGYSGNPFVTETNARIRGIQVNTPSAPSFSGDHVGQVVTVSSGNQSTDFVWYGKNWGQVPQGMTTQQASSAAVASSTSAPASTAATTTTSTTGSATTTSSTTTSTPAVGGGTFADRAPDPGYVATKTSPAPIPASTPTAGSATTTPSFPEIGEYTTDGTQVYLGSEKGWQPTGAPASSTSASAGSTAGGSTVPTVVDTKTTEYGTTINKMSDGTFRYADGSGVANEYDVSQARFPSNSTDLAGATTPSTAPMNPQVGDMVRYDGTAVQVIGTDGKGNVTIQGESGPQTVPAKDLQPMGDTPEAKSDTPIKPNASEGGEGGAGGVPEPGSLWAPVSVSNVPQYVLIIMEAVEGNKHDDATKKVRIVGAEPMGESQGTPISGASTVQPDTPISATTISGAANSLIALLNMGKIDISLLSKDIEKPKENTSTPAISMSAGTSGGQSAGTGQVTSTPSADVLTTNEQKEIRKRRALLLGEWATAATQIGEGSNAISSTFYDRAQAFKDAVDGAQGSLGGISAITDADRLVLFEITRGAALSAVQLGLQGAVNLNAIDEKTTTPSEPSSPAPSITIRPGESQ